MQRVRLEYVNAMRAAWAATVLSGRSMEEWKDQAEKVRVEYLAKGEMLPGVEEGGSVLEDKADEEEWCGITGVRRSKPFRAICSLPLYRSYLPAVNLSTARRVNVAKIADTMFPPCTAPVMCFKPPAQPAAIQSPNARLPSASSAHSR